MKMYRHALFFWVLILCSLVDAQANGGIFDNPHQISGNVLISSKRFKLEREQLDVKLNTVDYVAKATYYLKDSRKVDGDSTAMYFPVICNGVSGELEQKKFLFEKCLKKFDVKINDQPVQGEILLESQINKNKTLENLSNSIRKRALKNISSDVEDDYHTMMAENGVMYVFLKIEIPTNVQVKTIVVQYETQYQQIDELVSDWAHTEYGDANMIYDFFPAAAWMGDEDKELIIKLDISSMQSSLSYNKKIWPFVEDKDELTLKLHNPNFSKLPPLILTTSNGYYQDFISDMELLKKHKIEYSVKVISATPSESNHNDIRALFDQNPNTFWCWKGKSAILEMELDPYTFSDNSYYSNNSWFYDPENFSGLVILNGALLSKQVFDKFGLVREFEASSDNLKKEESSAVKLKLPIMKNDKDKFQAFTTVTEGDMSSENYLVERKSSFESAKEINQKQIGKKKIFIKIKDVYKKKDTDESCISEIYPIYNGG